MVCNVLVFGCASQAAAAAVAAAAEKAAEDAEPPRRSRGARGSKDQEAAPRTSKRMTRAQACARVHYISFQRAFLRCFLNIHGYSLWCKCALLVVQNPLSMGTFHSATPSVMITWALAKEFALLCRRLRATAFCAT